MLQPEEKANNLLKRVNTLAGIEFVADSLALKRLELEAKELIKIDAVHAYAALGAIACIKRDARGVKDYYTKALNLSSNDVSILANYSISLFKLGLFIESKQYAEKAYEISQHSDLSLLQILIEASLLSGDLEESLKWLADWDKKSPNQSYPIQADIKMANTILRDNLVTNTDSGRFLSLAYSLLSQKGFDVNEVMFRTYGDEVLYQVKVDADIDKIVDLNFELAETLVDAELIPLVSRAITVMYVPVSVN